MFLTQFWEEFYTLAKYGDETRDIPPTQIFRAKELEVALDHAWFCQNLCRDLIDAILSEAASE